MHEKLDEVARSSRCRTTTEPVRTTCRNQVVSSSLRPEGPGSGTSSPLELLPADLLPRKPLPEWAAKLQAEWVRITEEWLTYATPEQLEEWANTFAPDHPEWFEYQNAAPKNPNLYRVTA